MRIITDACYIHDVVVMLFAGSVGASIKRSPFSDLPAQGVSTSHTRNKTACPATSASLSALSCSVSHLITTSCRSLQQQYDLFLDITHLRAELQQHPPHFQLP